MSFCFHATLHRTDKLFYSQRIAASKAKATAAPEPRRVTRRGAAAAAAATTPAEDSGSDDDDAAGLGAQDSPIKQKKPGSIQEQHAQRKAAKAAAKAREEADKATK